MFKKEFFDDLTQKFSALIPEGFHSLKEEFEKNTHAILQNTFAKVNLVTREEFDVQANVLKKTRSKLEQLEKQVLELEKIVAGTK
jgi:ubiquinone biosynthesis accessory factor UbiK